MAPSEAAAEIAHGGESAFDRGARVGNRKESELRDIHLEKFQDSLIKVAGEIEGEMGVRIHETGRKRRVAEIDDLRALRNGQVAAGIHDLVALNNDDAVGHQRLCFSVKETGGLQCDHLIGRMNRKARAKPNQDQNQTRESKSGSHGLRLETIRGMSKKERLVSHASLRLNRQK